MMNEQMRNPRRQAAWDTTGGLCFYCQTKLTPDRLPMGGLVTEASRRCDAYRMQLDHMLAPSRGGTDEPSNLKPACGLCNTQKGEKTPEEYRLWLFQNGIVPNFIGSLQRDWLAVGSPAAIPSRRYDTPFKNHPYLRF